MLKDRDLLAKLKGCLSDERRVLAEFLRHLTEVDRRRLYAREGYPSLYAYLTGELGLSESSAYRRIQVARASREFPALLRHVEAGDLHLVGAGLLAPVLTRENCERLLSEARRKSKREIESLIFSLSAQLIQPPMDQIRQLPIRVAVPKGTSTGEGDVDNSARRVDHSPEIPPPPPPEKRVSIHFVADEEFLQCLNRARELLRPKYPEGRLENVFHEALRLYLDKKDPERKFTARPGVSASSSASRYIAASTRTAVWKRDGGRCTYISPEKKRCEARSALEFDHIVPWAKGGLSVESNLRLCCRAHNQWAARREFGAQWMDRKIRETAIAGLSRSGEG